jgi:NADH:ubiquinone oxidoreductase subunit 4 (subunit M)
MPESVWDNQTQSSYSLKFLLFSIFSPIVIFWSNCYMNHLLHNRWRMNRRHLGASRPSDAFCSSRGRKWTVTIHLATSCWEPLFSFVFWLFTVTSSPYACNSPSTYSLKFLLFSIFSPIVIFWSNCYMNHLLHNRWRMNRRQLGGIPTIRCILSVVWTTLGPLPRWVPGSTTRWAPGTTRLALHGTWRHGAQGLHRSSTRLGSCTCSALYGGLLDVLD